MRSISLLLWSEAQDVGRKKDRCVGNGREREWKKKRKKEPL